MTRFAITACALAALSSTGLGLGNEQQGMHHDHLVSEALDVLQAGAEDKNVFGKIVEDLGNLVEIDDESYTGKLMLAIIDGVGREGGVLTTTSEGEGGGEGEGEVSVETVETTKEELFEQFEEAVMESTEPPPSPELGRADPFLAAEEEEPMVVTVADDGEEEEEAPPDPLLPLFEDPGPKPALSPAPSPRERLEAKHADEAAKIEAWLMKLSDAGHAELASELGKTYEISLADPPDEVRPFGGGAAPPTPPPVSAIDNEHGRVFASIIDLATDPPPGADFGARVSNESLEIREPAESVRKEIINLDLSELLARNVHAIASDGTGEPVSVAEVEWSSLVSRLSLSLGFETTEGGIASIFQDADTNADGLVTEEELLQQIWSQAWDNG
ncbi:hypothetical protein HKI87_07g50530 [Chloropicon roscoffensis]|uniref:EF-hand domain-containing protein n=1 Tax=Chloropicon roscoffensis TaxID=1461544 RepID=A0AAX4PC09_9CHLO